MELLELINTRRSVRKWNGEKATKEQMRTILEAGMNAPSAGNEQAWSFVVLEGEMLTKYREINPNCPPNPPQGILVCVNKQAEIYPGAGSLDCSAAIQNMLLAVHAMGLGGVWTHVFPDKVDGIVKLLSLPEHIRPFACVAFGKPHSEPAKYESRYREELVHHNKW